MMDRKVVKCFFNDSLKFENEPGASGVALLGGSGLAVAGLTIAN
jgi:hypothetical protein